MDEDVLQIERQIERCRRLAELQTDDEVRHSLERLAAEYEARLRAQPGSFMLSPLRAAADDQRSGVDRRHGIHSRDGTIRAPD
jgi:hypothetical protein